MIHDDSLPLDLRDEGVERLRAQAERNDPYAQLLLGRLYWDGPLLTPDWLEARHWFERVAQSLPDAQYALGKLLLTDDVEVHDRGQGIRWLTQTAEGGHMFAAYCLAKEFLKDGNTAEALLWPTASAKADNPYAKYLLGKLYWEGEEIPQDMGQAVYCLTQAAEQGLIPTNPAAEVEPPKVIRQPMNILNEEQLDNFMDTIKADPIWHDFFYTELTTGLRLGEICGLMWTDFDGRAGTLHIRRTLHREKGGRLVAGDTKTYARIRKILLPPSTAELLQARKTKSFSPWIFHDPIRPEVPVNPSAAYHQMKKLLAQAELPSIRFHDLRHIFATLALQNGADIKTVSSMLGHYDAGFTLRTYTHAARQMQDQAAKTMGNFITQMM